LGEAIALRTRSRTLAEARDAKAKVNLVMLAPPVPTQPSMLSSQPQSLTMKPENLSNIANSSSTQNTKKSGVHPTPKNSAVSAKVSKVLTLPNNP
jgi:hypothetical protein